ncbi:MAG: branched-chain amino acid ABC transporter permease, partial [Stellaceae bacterium]
MSEALSAAIAIAFNGVAFAMVLYLVSVGLSVTMGLMGFVNLAHGVFAAAGGYVMTTLFNDYGVPFPLAVAIASVVVGAASIVLERGLYRRFYGGDELDQVLLTIAIVFMSIAAAKYIWGSEQQPMVPPPYLAGHFAIAGREFPTYRSFIIVAGAVLVTILWLGLDRTRLGAKIRAAVDNRRMAQSVGIDTSGLFSFTFALGTGLAALGGALGAELLPIFPSY